MASVDHFFALTSSMRPSAPAKNRSPTPTGRSSPACPCRSDRATPAYGWGQNDAHRPVQQLRLPLYDLTGMDIELLGELGQGLITLERRQCHLRLVCAVWICLGFFITAHFSGIHGAHQS